MPRQEKRKWCSEYVLEVFRQISVQGLVHLTYADRHRIENCTWMIILIVSTGCAIATCLSNWEHYVKNPIVMSMEHNYLEWQLEFPSTFLCPTIKVDENLLSLKAEEIADDDASNETIHSLKNYIRNLANSSFNRFLNLKQFVKYERFPQKNLLQLVSDVRFNLSYDVNEGSITKLTELLTEDGFCWAHNSKIANFFGISGKSPQIKRITDEPVMIVGSTENRDNVASVVMLNSPLKIYQQYSGETPNLASMEVRIGERSVLTLLLGALPVVSTPAVLELSVEQRRCRQPHESELVSSPHLHSYMLCRQQCRMDLALKLCGCLPFFYESTNKECDISGMLCLGEHSDQLVRLRDKNDKQIQCKCLPLCDEIRYYVWDKMEMQNSFGPTSTFLWKIERFPRTRLKRDILFSSIDLLVSFGGAVGLFLGCSVLSFVEIIYFFTLRLFFYLRERQKRPKEIIIKY